MSKGNSTKYKCSICGKTLRTYKELFLGGGPIPEIGSELDGVTVLKAFRQTHWGHYVRPWYLNLKVGNWITVNGQRICEHCQAN